MRPGGPLQSYHPGHHLHPVHRQQLARTPWGWRPGTVRRIDGLTFVVGYLDDGEVSVWHHEPVDGLEIGYPVWVHEQLHALETGGALLNVALNGGLGAVPSPEDPVAWLRAGPPAPAAVVDLRTGRGVRERPG